MSAATASARRRGRTSAALPSRPTDSGVPVRLGLLDTADRGQVVGCDLVEVAVVDPSLEHVLVDVDHERDPVVHRHGQRLRTAHATGPGGDGERAGERATETLAGDLGEALVGALQDALRADVDPRSRRHLAVHREALVFEAAELVPVRPVGHQVGVGDQHPWCPFVRAHDADRFARLDEHRFVALERGERAQHRPVRIPRAGGAPGAAVDDEPVGVLGHLGVEVVLQHPVRSLLRPAPAGQVRATRCSDTGDGRAEVAERISHVLQSARARRTVSTNDKQCHQLTSPAGVMSERSGRRSSRSSLWGHRVR